LEQVIALYVRSKQKKAQEQCAVTENKLLSCGHEISLSQSISDQDNEGDGVEALGSETDRVAIARASRCLEKLVAATYGTFLNVLCEFNIGSCFWFLFQNPFWW
jgi:hypothetical protein